MARLDALTNPLPALPAPEQEEAPAAAAVLEATVPAAAAVPEAEAPAAAAVPEAAAPAAAAAVAPMAAAPEAAAIPAVVHVPAAPAPVQLAPPALNIVPIPEALVVLPPVGEPVYERFRRQKPPTFEGTHDPAVAEDWLKKIKRIFAYMGLEDHEKVACAVHQLEKEAYVWWEYIMMLEDGEDISWDRFLEHFTEKYMRSAQMKVKMWEFMDLRQGNMTVAEYTSKFNELARFCPTMVPNDDTRKNKYMQGMKISIAKQIDSGSQGPTSFSDAVQRALRNESWDRAPSKVSQNR